MAEGVQLAFASCTGGLALQLVEEMRKLHPEAELLVIAEFPVGGARWIPYHPRRRFRDNLALCRAAVKGRKVDLAGVVLEPQVPYRAMRLMALLVGARTVVCFNERMGHFALRPRSAPAILRHIAWRAWNMFWWQLRGGGLFRQTWERLRRPASRAVLLWYWRARLAGGVAALSKRVLLPEDSGGIHGATLEPGISVVIPSRNGRHLLERCLPRVVRELGEGEIIIVDNGSDDGTLVWLEEHYPDVKVESFDEPLSFARAVNRGLGVAKRSRTCLLNNDMVVEPGFFQALQEAFARAPGLFCATAQILFPDGVRREETGKAVLADRTPEVTDFPVRCEEPLEGEDLSYVLYGSGGCSLFDTEKLRRLNGMDTRYDPAYVEDLDLGWRAWQRGWPTVYVAGARAVHEHRATTSRYYSDDELEELVELHYLRFLAQTVASHGIFRRQWRRAMERLRLLAESRPAARTALRRAWRAPGWVRPPACPVLREQAIAALGSGAVAVFPGRAPRGLPVVVAASPFLPYPTASGGAVRMWNLLSRAAEEFDLVLVSFVDELATPPDELRRVCAEVVEVRRVGSHLRENTELPDEVVEFRSEAFSAVLRETVRRWSPGLVQLEFTQMAQYAGDAAGAPTLLVEHDLTFDLYRQLAELDNNWEMREQAGRWARYEPRVWQEVDCVVTVSEEDRQRVDGRRVECLPNGVDTEFFQSSAATPEPGRLLFVGSFGHLPNLVGLAFFLREVWPKVREHSTLHILAGAQHEKYLRHWRDAVELPLDQPGIEVEGFVPDIRRAYERAELVVAPLEASAGTNIKILEAMAMGKAVITTPTGTAGLEVTPGVDIVEAAAGEFAEAILELQDDTSRRLAVGRAARETVERRYGWEKIAARQANLYHSLMRA